MTDDEVMREVIFFSNKLESAINGISEVAAFNLFSNMIFHIIRRSHPDVRKGYEKSLLELIEGGEKIYNSLRRYDDIGMN